MLVPLPSHRDVFYRRSVDRGATFGPEIQLDPGLLRRDAFLILRLRVEPPRVAVAWLETRSGGARRQVQLARSSDGGASFGPAARIGDYDPARHDCGHLALGLFGGVVHVAWSDNRSGRQQMYVASSPDFGATWRADQQLGGAGGQHAEIAGGSRGDAGIAFQTNPVSGRNRAVIAYTTDAGATWSRPVTLSGTTTGTRPGHATYNALYRNYLACWTTPRTFVGGIRPAQAEARGFAPGPASSLLGGRAILHFSDTWEWDGTDWAPLLTATEPGARAEHAATYDNAAGRIVVHGGTSRTASRWVDTWVLDSTPPARASRYGLGCAGAGGTISLGPFGNPRLGSTSFALDLASARPSAPGALWLALGPGSLPIGGCTLLVDPVTLAVAIGFATNTSGFAAIPIPVPAEPALLGVALFAQGVVVDATGLLGAVLSNGVRVDFGE
ncbi:MAG: sialidase family protein [Planctomycetota bacterium]